MRENRDSSVGEGENEKRYKVCVFVRQRQRQRGRERDKKTERDRGRASMCVRCVQTDERKKRKRQTKDDICVHACSRRQRQPLEEVAKELTQIGVVWAIFKAQLAAVVDVCGEFHCKVSVAVVFNKYFSI